VCHHGESPIPSLGISQEDGVHLQRLIAGGTEPVVTIEMTNRVIESSARNVIADLPGRTAPDEVVLAGAHLDSWDVAQGATDNGLGCAIVLEMARALVAVGARPRRTMRFAIWAAEETGLCGSTEYTRRWSDELARLAAVMNFDMTGAPFGYWTPGRPDPGPILRQLSTLLAPAGMDGSFASAAGLHSDHQPFMLAGVPIVGLLARLEGQGGHYYHSVGDTFEKISLPGLCRASVVGAHTLWALADAPECPFPHLSPTEVRKMIDEAGLFDALVSEGYDGPPMRVQSGAESDLKASSPPAG
jgi:carboxypeptidase Q